MPDHKRPALETIVFALTFVVLALDAGGGAGWGATSAHAVLAARMDHLASGPLYDVLAGVAALLPIGETGFRLGVLSALLGALTLTGVVAAVRVLVPRELGAALVAVLLLVVAPPFRDAAAFATPTMLAACGAVWSIALAARYAKQADARDALLALLACAAIVGSAPWLGAAFTIVVAVWLARAGARKPLAIGLAALGVLAVALWVGAEGSLPGAHGGLANLAAAGRGAAAIVVGAGLIGIAFAALTGLSNARGLALAALVTVVHEVVIGGNAPALLALLAIGGAIIPSAIVRATFGKLEGVRRSALAFATGLPLAGVALAMGATFTVEDPRSTPTLLVADLTSELPPGPGVFVATRATSWLALNYEMTVAGVRPDLALVPPLAPQQADVVVANALRAERIVGADAAAFGRLDVRFAIPRGRGFQLIGGVAPAMRVVGPATYPTRVGREQALHLAVERARHEAASHRLDVAARALGLEARFGAADLAVLAATLPTPERPALFGFLPFDERPGDWLIDVFGDDLAWVAGIPIPAVDERAPLARRLHAKWREILLGKTTPDDPAIATMGPRAVRATRELFKPAPEDSASTPDAARPADPTPPADAQGAAPDGPAK